MIYNYSLRRSDHDVKSGLALAQKIFMETESVHLVMVCMVRQGRYTQAIEYGKANGAKQDDYVQARPYFYQFQKWLQNVE
jgi:hypothetical protein